MIHREHRLSTEDKAVTKIFQTTAVRGIVSSFRVEYRRARPNALRFSTPGAHILPIYIHTHTCSRRSPQSERNSFKISNISYSHRDASYIGKHEKSRAKTNSHRTGRCTDRQSIRIFYISSKRFFPHHPKVNDALRKIIQVYAEAR